VRAQRRIVRQVDRLPSLITLLLGFAGSSRKGLDRVLLLLELSLLLFDLSLEVGDLPVEFVDF